MRSLVVAVCAQAGAWEPAERRSGAGEGQNVRYVNRAAAALADWQLGAIEALVGDDGEYLPALRSLAAPLFAEPPESDPAASPAASPGPVTLERAIESLGNAAPVSPIPFDELDLFN